MKKIDVIRIIINNEKIIENNTGSMYSQVEKSN